VFWVKFVIANELVFDWGCRKRLKTDKLRRKVFKNKDLAVDFGDLHRFRGKSVSDRGMPPQKTAAHIWPRLIATEPPSCRLFVSFSSM
jgi:hypothetical protein